MTDKIKLSKIILEKDFCFGITPRGNVYSWGTNKLSLNEKDSHIPKQVKFFENKFIFDIITTSTHCFAICKSGRLYAWGYTHHYDVLGIDKSTNEFIYPTLVPFKFFDKIEKVYTLSKTSFAITSTRKVYSWGTNISGSLGYENLKYIQRQSLPREIEFFKKLNIDKLFVYDEGCFAVSLDGTTYHWSGSDKLTPRLFDGLKGKKIKKIRYGFDEFFMALTEDGLVYSWGNNDYGKLGIGKDFDSEQPVLIEGLEKIEDIILGDNLTFAISKRGDVYFWGKHEYKSFWKPNQKLIKFPEIFLEDQSIIIDIQISDSFYSKCILLSSK